MTVEELLKPRYKVIADYPLALHKVGDILHPINNMSYALEGEAWKIDLSKYPHLFKPLAWYEERDVKDMPEYVRMGIDCRIPLGTILKANWRFFTSTKDIAHYNEKPEYWIDSKFFFPATETEYLNYINQHP